MKKIIYIIMISLGLLMLISLYVLVCLVSEHTFPALKYVIMIIGYLAITLFGIGFLLLIKEKKKGD